MEERRGVQVVIIFLSQVNVQKAYDLGVEIATKVGGIFNGFNVFTFASMPPRDHQTLNFFLDGSKVGEVVEAVVKGLELPQNGYMFQAVPTTQYIPRTQISRATA